MAGAADRRGSLAALEQRLCGDADAGGDRPAQVIPSGDGVEGGAGAEIHHAGRPAVQVLDRSCIHDTICADRSRVFIADAHPGLHTRVHHQRLVVHVLLAGILNFPGQGGTTEAMQMPVRSDGE